MKYRLGLTYTFWSTTLTRKSKKKDNKSLWSYVTAESHKPPHYIIFKQKLRRKPSIFQKELLYNYMEDDRWAYLPAEPQLQLADILWEQNGVTSSCIQRTQSQNRQENTSDHKTFSNYQS